MIRVIYGNMSAPTGRLLEERLLSLPQEGLVNWSGVPHRGTLNANAFTNKLRQLQLLREGGIVAIPSFEEPLRQWPLLPPHPGWLPRTNFHRAGRDFRRRVRPDYWVEPLNLTEEWRVHVFRTKKDNMRVIRCAKKLPVGPEAHPWIRNHDYGWRFSYVDGCPDQAKGLAREALRKLTLDFGAVDLGLTPEGQPYILEVNTCPALDEGNTLVKYVENITERFS